jgi:hypothetical protein
MANKLIFIMFFLTLSAEYGLSQVVDKPYCDCYIDSMYKSFNRNQVAIFSKRKVYFSNNDTVESLDLNIDNKKLIKRYISFSTDRNIKTSYFSQHQDSLKFLHLRGGLEVDMDIKLPQLEYFETELWYFGPFPSVVNTSTRLKVLSYGLDTLELVHLRQLPKTMRCLFLFISEIKTDSIPIELFDLPVLSALYFYTSRFMEHEKILKMPQNIPLNYSVEYLNLPIDLSDVENLQGITMFPNLKMLTVGAFSGDNYYVVELLRNIKKIDIPHLDPAKERIIKRLHPGVSFY